MFSDNLTDSGQVDYLETLKNAAGGEAALLTFYVLTKKKLPMAAFVELFVPKQKY